MSVSERTYDSNSHHLLYLYYEFKVLLYESVHQRDTAAGRLRCNRLQLPLRQNHDPPVRAIVALQVAYHVEHGLVGEAIAEDGLDDPLLALLGHAGLRILLLHQLEEVHVVQCRLAVVWDRSLVKHELIERCL